MRFLRRKYPREREEENIKTWEKRSIPVFGACPVATSVGNGGVVVSIKELKEEGVGWGEGISFWAGWNPGSLNLP